MLFSEIDPVQNRAVNAAVNTAGFSETMVWNGQPNGCGNPASSTYNQCYPPAVNYTPLYYLINGRAFDKTNAAASVFPSAPATVASGNVLVRMVNAGLRMHVPSIVGALTGSGAGFGLIAEDGNPLPGVTRVQSEVFMPAGKTYDVTINVPAAGTTALPIFDRELSLSANSNSRDGGMLAYISVNGAVLPSTGAFASTAAVANADTYSALVAGQSLTVSDPLKGVIANDVNVYGVQLLAQAANGTVTLNGNGTFTYQPTGTATSDSFTYCANGSVTGAVCSSGLTATVSLGATNIIDSGIVCTTPTFTASNAKYLAIRTPGLLANCTDGKNLPLSVVPSSLTATGVTVVPDASGGFAATAPAAGPYSFTVQVQNPLKQTATATVNLVFPAGSGLAVTVMDGADHTSTLTDYRWIIEEDRTFFVDPKCTQNPLPAGCPTVTSQGAPAVFGTNFHTSYMPLVATGCTGPQSCEGGQTQQGANVVCDQGNGACRPDPTGSGFTAVDPSQVLLDATKRYYISILPGDAAQPFEAGYAGAPDCSPAGKAAGSCGHGMGGAPIATGQLAVTIFTQPSPYPPAKLSVFVFEDDFPLNGEHDAGGGIDVLSPQEPGLGGFQITLFDDAGGTGDATGQPTYDMFNMPLTNSLAGTIDPTTGADACPISTQVTANATTGDGTQKGVVGMIVTCPKYESDGTTLSPLAGQAIVNNLYQGRYGVVATPNADRIARGEEWLQTNTLDGQKAHDSFLRIGEQAYFQEFGPAGYHVSIGFANPQVINNRLASFCAGVTCGNEVKGHVTTARMSRPPDERLYGSGSRDSFAFTQCYASLGDPDGADFAFVRCDDQGNFDFTGIPQGNWKLTLFDQWNDQIVDGISTPVGLASGSGSVDIGEVAVHQWQANIYTRSFIDNNGDGVSTHDASGNDLEPGLALVATNIRFRDGSFSNFNNTDLNGYAGFNEVFPLFNWYVVETDTTRYKTTGVHVVYDAGGPTDGTPGGGTSAIGQFFANTIETTPLPTSPMNLRVPGARYCKSADCPAGDTAGGSTGRVDPPLWFGSYGWQGFAGQNSFLEFGKKPFADGENGGIHGHVVYASTRPFDDPQLLLQLSWEPLVPHVKLNLYREDVATDGVTQTLTLVDHTETSSFDDWAQGFRTDGVPNMNCPGQLRAPTTTTPGDIFFFGLENQPNYLNWYNSQHGGPAVTALPNNSQFKCYDGMHNWNQLQPAPYDGMYTFPSVTSINPTTGKPAGTNCTACVTNPDSADPYRFGLPMLPAGKYVVEVVVPSGYELVKEEDKNILIGDNYIAPAVQQFGGLGSIYILPDQAEIAANYNSSNPLNSTNSLGRVSSLPSHEGDTGSVESFWPCVGAARVVPDFISLFPGSGENAPFAGATRNLCDRKEVTLTDQTAALAKFYIFTSTHAAAHYTGVITDDFTAEFDPFSPQFGEKFAPAFLPVSVKDWSGNEVSRTYSDQFGSYNGLNYSTWEVNPPNPTGYGPTMMVTCMNDAGTGATPDPLFQPSYSQFCYELPFMPGQTGYFDTPVVPTSAFSEGYNHPDCNYPDLTPAIASVTSVDIAGPWVSASGHQITITALGDKPVDSYGYTGPSVTTAPYNQQKVLRHYHFGTAPGTVALVGSDGVAHALTGVSWGDLSITGNVPTGLPNCNIKQQVQYGGSTAQCGELVITAANGNKSIDTVTVTVGGKKPTLLAAGATIQSSIDAAKPGDMIIVPAGAYNELLLMWKPVRLQGVGAASSVINANTQTAGAGKLDPWRRQAVCLFGLALNGTPISNSNPYDPSHTFNCTSDMRFSVDRLPLEATVGWDATLNGNLAEQLSEPTLLGAFEGAGITVLAKGVAFPNGTNPFAADVFPDGTLLLNNSTSTRNGCGRDTATAHNPFPSSFWCNPSSIDGLSVTNSSQGGGGIMVHGWGHNVQIANNRIYNNQGTLSGGITVGQGEHPDVYLAGGIANTVPGSCENSNVTNLSLPYCFDMNVNVHHNSVIQNSSLGDELFSSTPAGAGGVTFCNGSDYYLFNNNWVCGNMSTGDGGGVVHLGFTKNGDIEHNAILFNQSTNPTITTNGGGLLVMGAPDQDPPCAATNDNDCLSPPGTITPSDGTGPGLVINANLIMGNAADSGSGGGLRLQHINGTDVLNFPNGSGNSNSSGRCSSASLNGCRWNTVSVTNNIITNNVAGWDGGGVSLQDALAVNIINNTIASNDSTASSGVLFGSLFAPLASAPGVNCTAGINNEQSCPQVAGLVSVTNSAILEANLPATGFSCPAGHGTSGNNGSCRTYSVPLLDNNVIWQNRSFVIGVGNFGTGNQVQQKIVTLLNSSFTGPAATPAGSQANIGTCPTASYWDIGVRGDSGPTNHAGGRILGPAFSVLTSTTGYAASNTNGSPALISQYCNGSRVPPEVGGLGWEVPPGTNETNALPTPVFSLTPSATVDEGNNWINLRWGPLALAKPANNAVLGNYGLTSTSSAINHIPAAGNSQPDGAYTLAPSLDYFGTQRKNGSVDAGAVEFAGGTTVNAVGSVTGGPLAFGNVALFSTAAAQTLTLHSTGTASVTGITLAFSSPRYFRPTGAAGGTCGGTLVAGATCTINVRFRPTALGLVNGTLTITSNVAITGSPVSLSGTGVASGIAIAPDPLTITANPITATGTVTVTNTGASSVTISNVTVAGGSIIDYFFSQSGTNTCSGATLAPAGTCSVGVRFTRVLAGTGDYPGTITFTDTATGSPHTGDLIGHVN